MSLQEFLLLFLRQERGLLGTEVTASSSPVPKDTPELNQPHLFLFSLSLAQQQESSEPQSSSSVFGDPRGWKRRGNAEEGQ